MSKIFIIIKQDAVKRKLTVNLLNKFLVNFKVTKNLLRRLTLEEARELYSVHQDKPFFDDLVNFMIDGDSYIAVLETHKIDQEMAIKLARDTVIEIREEFGTSVRENCIHASDSVEAMVRESSIFFA